MLISTCQFIDWHDKDFDNITEFFIANFVIFNKYKFQTHKDNIKKL